MTINITSYDLEKDSNIIYDSILKIKSNPQTIALTNQKPEDNIDCVKTELELITNELTDLTTNFGTRIDNKLPSDHYGITYLIPS